MTARLTETQLREIERRLPMSDDLAATSTSLPSHAKWIADCAQDIRDLLAELRRREDAMHAFVSACYDLPDDGELPPSMETIYQHARAMRALLPEPPDAG
jgi:hypothetical protein